MLIEATWVGQAWVHRPHPVQASAWTTGTKTACRLIWRGCGWMLMALSRTGQTRWQTSQRRPCHDRQVSGSITARPMRASSMRGSAASSAPVGQALAQGMPGHM
ncbi:MAG: hypothetical protein RL669_1028 [Pseudomonadota bacterium]